MDQKVEEVAPTIEPQKPSRKFTRKHFYLTVVIFMVIGTAIGLLIEFIPKNNYVEVTVINQRDDFQQKDQICITQENQNMYNCTEVNINSTRVTTDKNEKNTTNLIFIRNLKLSQFTKNEDGSKNYSDLTEVNSLIEQNLQTRLRFLQSTNTSDQCYNISASECGTVDEVPLMTFITDSVTGEVISIGIPSGVDDSLIQPLVSNIVHIGANTQNVSEATFFDANSPTNGTRRRLVSNFKNLYQIGQLTFLPKYSVTKQQSGEVIISKKITKSDNIGNENQMNFFKQFDQQQDTVLDINSRISSSRIQTFSLIDNSITSSDPQDANQQDQTQIESDSNLITVETTSDEQLTTALNDVQSKQNVQYYSISEIQERLSNQVTQSVEIDQDQLGGNRLLGQETESLDQNFNTTEIKGECQETQFNQSKILKEVTVFGQKVAVNTEFQGKKNGQNATGYLRTCITLSGSCIYQIQRNDFAYSGPEVANNKTDVVQKKKFFKITLLLLGYPVNVGADIAYSWGYARQNIKTVTDLGFQNVVNASVKLTAYGELNIIRFINIRTGSNGVIFQGSLNAIVLYAYDKSTGLAQPSKYFIHLDLQMQALTFDVYAQYNLVIWSWQKKCFGRRLWRLCWQVPSFSYYGWKDILRKTYQLAPTLKTNVLYSLKSKCYT